MADANVDQERFVTLDSGNLADHHLCCALGDPKHERGVELKKAWLKKRFDEGLVFRKLDVRGKVFIEYMPAESAWRPVIAPGWLVIHCLWVSGKYAKQGHASTLVHDALDDARVKGRLGLVVASAKTKRPFLSDPKWLNKRGFVEVDRVGEWRLWALPVNDRVAEQEKPRFSESMSEAGPSTDGEFVARFDHQCPFNVHWSQQVVESLTSRGLRARQVHVDSAQQAQQSRSPLATYGLERDGTLVCHHLTTDSATGRLLDKLGD